MHWKQYYEKCQMTAEEAVAHIKSNDRVIIGHAVGEPCHLVDAMVGNAEAYKNVEIVHMVPMGKCAYCQPQYLGHFHHNSLFVGPRSRKALEEGRSDYIPCFFFAPAI